MHLFSELIPSTYPALQIEPLPLPTGIPPRLFFGVAMGWKLNRAAPPPIPGGVAGIKSST
jgi:hypothetical protein